MIQAIALGGLDQTETQSTGIGLLCGVAEQKILSRHHKRLHRELGKVIENLISGVKQTVPDVGLLFVE